MEALAQRVLNAAAREIGTAGALARYLEVELVVLEGWIAGREVPPAELVLRAIEIVVYPRAPFSS
jgi:hypothetical protein